MHSLSISGNGVVPNLVAPFIINNVSYDEAIGGISVNAVHAQLGTQLKLILLSDQKHFNIIIDKFSVETDRLVFDFKFNTNVEYSEIKSVVKDIISFSSSLPSLDCVLMFDGIESVTRECMSMLKNEMYYDISVELRVI